MIKIPKSYKVGGCKIDVCLVERCDNNLVGTAMLASGKIEIAIKYNKDGVQSEDSQRNTFYHELTHTILDTMGEFDLSKNETFVCSFSSFLTEAMQGAEFKEERK